MAVPSTAVSQRPAGKRKRRFAIVLSLLLLVVWLAPTLVGRSPVLAWIVRSATRDVNGTVSVGSASLGWFSPVVLREVSIRDATGEPLLTIPQVESERTLLGLLLHSSNPGRFRCEKAAMDVVFAKEATNLETALANYLTSKAESATPLQPTADRSASGAVAPGLVVDIASAKITVHDRHAQQKWVLDPVEVHFALNQQGSAAVDLHVQALVPGVSPGLLQTELTVDRGGKALMKGKMDRFPMALAAPVLRRFQPGFRLEGRVQGHWDLAWDGARGRFDGELAVRDCLVAGPALGDDTLRLTQITVPWKAAYEDKRLRIEKAEVICDVGQVKFQGNIDVAAGGAARFVGSELTCSADIDLARLAETLPATLRLHKDARLVAGRLTMSCKNVPGPRGSMVWQGKINTTDLHGLRAGQHVNWPEPITLSFQVRQPATGLPSVEHLRCESSFLKLDADGSIDQFTVMASVDLPKLVEPLGRFFDLGQMRLEGQAGGQLTVLRKQPDRFQVAGGGFLRSFHCELVKGQAWNEESLTLTVHADGKNMPSGAQQIDGGYVQIRSGNDLLDIQVLEPIVDPLKGPWGNLQVKVEGDLTRWQERARPWTGALEAWPLAGNLAAKVDVQSASKRLGYDADVTVTNFILGPAANPKWRESQLRLASKGAVDWAKDNCRFDQVLLESQFLRCVATGGLGGLSTTQDVDIAGQLTYDLEKLGPFLRPYLGSGVKVTGRDARPFTLNGPLAPRTVNQGVTLTVPSQTSLVALKGDAGLGWKTLKAYGCDVGPAEVRAKLNGGWLVLDPMETTLNGGRLRLAANLRLQPEPMLLQLPQGPVVDHAQITPAMCASALGYAIPALSGAAEADGLVSLTLEGGTLNLADMTKSELRGTFTLHSATIGGGPLVRELSGLFRSSRPASLVKETRVPFQVAGGRVYHQNFELAFPDFTVRTSGSVGTDGTVALVAEMPVPPQWLGNNPLGSALAKQTIRLPITGTLDNPRIDPHAIQAASAEFLRGAASNVIRQELDNNLKKLLGR